MTAKQIEEVATLLGRLPHLTRCAIAYALRLQDHIATGLDEDRATDQLWEALKLAGVEVER